MNNFIIKPSELSTLNLPYLDDHFAPVESTLKPFFKPELITIITSYADISKKVDTQKMISIFLNGIPGQFSPVPKDFIEKMKKKFSDCMTCLDESLQASVRPLKDATTFMDSDERKLMILARLYFKHKDEQDCDEIRKKCSNVLSTVIQAYDKNETESNEFIDKIVGIDIVERCDYRTDKRQCHSFVFGQELFPRGSGLFNIPDKVMAFLKDKNLRLIAKAEPKAIVVYCRPNEVTHYGIVESIDSKGNMTIISKFGLNNLHRHRPELVPYMYGTQLFCFAN